MGGAAAILTNRWGSLRFQHAARGGAKQRLIPRPWWRHCGAPHKGSAKSRGAVCTASWGGGHPYMPTRQQLLLSVQSVIGAGPPGGCEPSTPLCTSTACTRGASRARTGAHRPGGRAPHQGAAPYVSSVFAPLEAKRVPSPLHMWAWAGAGPPASGLRRAFPNLMLPPQRKTPAA